METGLTSAIFLIIIIVQFVNIIYIAERTVKSGSGWSFTPPYNQKVQLNKVTPTLIYVLASFSPMYSILILSCLCLSQMKGGFFVRQNMNYSTTMYLILFVTSMWFLSVLISWFIDRVLIYMIGGFFALNGISTFMIAIWLFLQKRSYERSMSNIWFENNKVGRQLSRQQAHSIFELQKHKRIVDNPVMYGGRPTSHYMRAIQINKYYEMQKSIHEMENTIYTPIEIIQNKKNEMAVKCKTYSLKPIELKKFGELAKLDGIVLPSVGWKSPYLTPNYNSRMSYSYTDLRRDSQAPPSYKSQKSSTSCSTSLCEIDL